MIQFDFSRDAGRPESMWGQVVLESNLMEQVFLLILEKVGGQMATLLLSSLI